MVDDVESLRGELEELMKQGVDPKKLAVGKSVPVLDKPPTEEQVLQEVAKALGE